MKGSPQLGFQERKWTVYVKGLSAHDVEELVEFYHRRKTMAYKIGLQ